MSAPSLTAVLGRAAKAAISPTLSPAEIARRVAQAEEFLADLETQRGELALAAETDEAGAGNKLAAFNADVARAKDRLVTLRAAQAQAVKVDEAAKRKAAADIHTSRAKAARVHLAEAAKRAQAVSALTAQLADEWFGLIKAVNAVRAASPVPLQSPGLSHGGLAQWFKLEIDRANLTVEGFARMPGGVLSDHPNNHINPANVATPFGERVGAAVDDLVKRLSEKPA